MSSRPTHRPSSASLSRRRFMAWAAAGAAVPAFAAGELPLCLIVPVGAGGPTDRAARALAGGLAACLERQVEVANLPGDAGAAATRAMLATTEDSRKLLFAPLSIAALPLTMKAPPFVSLTDLDVLATVGGNRLCLYVHRDLAVDSLPAFLERARRAPLRMGQVTLGDRLVTSQLGRAGGFGVESLPFATGPEMLRALAEGRLHAAVAPSSSGADLVADGRLRRLACAADQRIAALPQVPTMAEAGLPGLQAPTGHVIVASNDLSVDEHGVLVNALLGAAARAEVRAEFGRLHLDGPALGPQQSLALVRETERVWRRFVQDAGIAPQ